MRRKITDSISVSEMSHLRESGLSDKEICQILDISYSTLVKYLGVRNPRKKKRSPERPIIPTSSDSLCNVFANRYLGRSEYHEYAIQDKVVTIMNCQLSSLEDIVHLTVEDLDRFVADLQDLKALL